MENVEEVVKVNSNDIVEIFKFIGRIFKCNKGEYLSVMENVAEKREGERKLFSIKVIPNFSLAPIRRYSLYSLELFMEGLGFKILYENEINADKFLPFKILKTPNEVNRRIEATVGSDFGGKEVVY